MVKKIQHFPSRNFFNLLFSTFDVRKIKRRHDNSPVSIDFEEHLKWKGKEKLSVLSTFSSRRLSDFLLYNEIEFFSLWDSLRNFPISVSASRNNLVLFLSMTLLGSLEFYQLRGREHLTKFETSQIRDELKWQRRKTCCICHRAIIIPNSRYHFEWWFVQNI